MKVTIKAFFEMIPILLALTTVVICILLAHMKKDKLRGLYYFMAFTASLLLIAQSSWYNASVMGLATEDSWLANVIWTIFNTCTMICFSYFIVIVYKMQQKNPGDSRAPKPGH